jgi:hypothetical protein
VALSRTDLVDIVGHAEVQKVTGPTVFEERSGHGAAVTLVVQGNNSRGRSRTICVNTGPEFFIGDVIVGEGTEEKVKYGEDRVRSLRRAKMDATAVRIQLCF